jgi:hypothetical protein
MDKNQKDYSIEVNLRFLERTRNGKYCEIDKDVLQYPRREEENHTICHEEDFYYSMS